MRQFIGVFEDVQVSLGLYAAHDAGSGNNDEVLDTVVTKGHVELQSAGCLLLRSQSESKSSWAAFFLH